jgi:hypothetical protein
MIIDFTATRFWVQTCRKMAGFIEHHAIAEAALKGGAEGIVLAEDDFEEEELIETALRVKAVCDEFEAPLLVRDHLTAAFVANAQGLLLGPNGPAAEQFREVEADGKWLILERGAGGGVGRPVEADGWLLLPGGPLSATDKVIIDVRGWELEALSLDKLDAQRPTLFQNAAMDKKDVTKACQMIKTTMEWA